jgi:DNA polymerase-3 subunit alpha
VEVVMFGRAYELCQHEVEPDVVIAVEGDVQMREGTHNVVASALRRVEVAAADGPVVLNVSEGDLTLEVVHGLRRILAEYPGARPLQIAVRNGSKTTMVDVPGYPVEATSAFAADVKSLLGAAALSLP